MSPHKLGPWCEACLPHSSSSQSSNSRPEELNVRNYKVMIIIFYEIKSLVTTAEKVLGRRMRLSEPRLRITALDSHVTDFQDTSEGNSCFVTIQFSREILPFGRPITNGVYSTNFPR